MYEYTPPFIYYINYNYIMGKSKTKTEDTVNALIDREAHIILIKEGSRRKLSKKWSFEECSYKYLASEAIKQIYGDK